MSLKVQTIKPSATIAGFAGRFVPACKDTRGVSSFLARTGLTRLFNLLFVTESIFHGLPVCTFDVHRFDIPGEGAL